MSNIPKYLKKISIKRILIILILIILTIAVFLYISWYNQPRIVFFDVGQGDSIFISSGSNQVLIDGGPDKTVLEKLSRYMPVYDRTIETVVLTHPHSDHINGLVEVISRYQVKQIMLTNVEYDSATYTYLKNLLKSKKIKVIHPINNLVFGYPDMIFQTLYPRKDLSGVSFEDLNDSSIVHLLKLENKRILLTGDIGIDEEKWLIGKYGEILKSDILKVGHHGSITSSSEDFLKTVDGDTAIISVGENDFGHPSGRVINRLMRASYEVLRTNIDGDISF